MLNCCINLCQAPTSAGIQQAAPSIRASRTHLSIICAWLAGLAAPGPQQTLVSSATQAQVAVDRHLLQAAEQLPAVSAGLPSSTPATRPSTAGSVTGAHSQPGSPEGFRLPASLQQLRFRSPGSSADTAAPSALANGPPSSAQAVPGSSTATAIGAATSSGVSLAASALLPHLLSHAPAGAGKPGMRPPVPSHPAGMA